LEPFYLSQKGVSFSNMMDCSPMTRCPSFDYVWMTAGGHTTIDPFEIVMLVFVAVLFYLGRNEKLGKETSKPEPNTWYENAMLVAGGIYVATAVVEFGPWWVLWIWRGIVVCAVLSAVTLTPH
jgi:hypothetical protein